MYKLTNDYEYTVHSGHGTKFKLQRTITELGVCDTFNSILSPYLSPEYFITNQLPDAIHQPLLEVSYFDSMKFIEIENVRESDVILGFRINNPKNYKFKYFILDLHTWPI